METRRDEDLRILRALYVGNHLEEYELERALKIVFLLDKEIKARVKK